MLLEKFEPLEVESQIGEVESALFLPWPSTLKGNRLDLESVPEPNQFHQQILPCECAPHHHLDPVYGQVAYPSQRLRTHSDSPALHLRGRPRLKSLTALQAVPK